MANSRPRLNVLFLIRSLDLGGAEGQLTYLARGLAASGHTVCVAVYYLTGPHVAELLRSGVRVVSLEKRGRWDVIAFVWRLSRLIQSERPDILYSFKPTENLASLFASRYARASLRVVWGIRSSDVDASVYGLLAKIVYKLQKWLAHTPDLVISNSQAGLEQLLPAVAQSRSLVIPNGIDVARFRPDAGLARIGRTMLHLPDNRLIVALVGRLDPMKGHECFLRAAALVAARLPETLFLIVGSGSHDYYSSLTRIASRLGIVDQVVWHEAIPHIEAIYNGIDVLVSSSLFGEGFPNVVAEAMACGTPVVVSDVGDAARVVGHHGELVPRNNPSALAAGIVQALTTRNARSAAARRAWIVTNFSIDSLVANTDAALSVLARAGTA